MAIPLGLNELAKLDLVACDMAYGADSLPGGNKPLIDIRTRLATYPDTAWGQECPYPIPGGWEVAKKVNDPTTGFKAVGFINLFSNEVIIAMGGTDGPNTRDWLSNTRLGWDQWTANKVKIFDFIDTLGFAPSMIHFTGQSLGGGLAEYAAYEYLARAREEDRPALKARMTLVTFNGFGSEARLRQEYGNAFVPKMLAGLNQSGAFFVANDLVSRLGNGHVGMQTFRLDYTANKINPDTGERYSLGFKDAHRIETAFYPNLGFGRGFNEARPGSPSMLFLAEGQKFAALWAALLMDRGTSPDDNKYLLGAAIGGAIAFAPIDEVVEAGRVIVATADAAGWLGSGEIRRKNLATANVLLRDPILNIAGRTLLNATFIANWWANVLGADAAGKQKIKDGFKKVSALDVNIAEDTTDAFAQASLYFSSFSGVSTDPHAQALVDLAFSRDELATTILNGGPTWLKDALTYLETKAIQSGKSGRDLVELEAHLLAFVDANKGTWTGGDAARIAQIDNVLTDFTKFGVAAPIANANGAFTAKYAGTYVDFGSLSQVDYAGYETALEAIASDASFLNIRSLLESARDIVAAAGELPVVKNGADSNPLDGSNTIAAASTSIGEGGSQLYTVYLPYATGSAQRVRLQIVGASVDSFAQSTGANFDQIDSSGTFEVVIPQGQRQASFVLLQNKNVSANSTLTMSAILLDENGNPTHQPQTVATISLTAVDEGTDTPQTTYSIFGDQTGTSHDAYGNVVNGTPAPGRIDFLIGSPGNDRIEGLGGDDAVNAGDGDDYVLGGEGNDTLAGQNGRDRIEGGMGRDFVLAGADNDLVLGQEDSDFLLAGNEGDDRIYGGAQADEEAVFNSDTANAIPGEAEWLDGGDGSDRLIGSAYDNVIFGGAGEDVLAGGAGNDFLYGDRDVVITPPPPIQLGTTVTLSKGEVNVAGGADVIFGGGGNDVIEGGVGADTLFGNAGDDLLFGDANDLPDELGGGDFIDGGDGNDEIHGQQGNDALYGGAGDDLIQGDDPGQAQGDDYLSGEDGNDILIGAGGNDILYGGKGDDQLHGDGANVPLAQQGNDELYGGEGDDSLNGYGGDDLLDGGVGNDTLVGGLGKDRLLGGTGDDTLTGDEGSSNADGGDADFMDGGEGDDFLFGQGGDDRMFGGAGKDWLQGGGGNDQLYGGAGEDTLFGEAGADRLDGGDGKDELHGGEGADVLAGGAGDDTLFGEEDADTLNGNAGDDRIQAGAGDDSASGGDGNDLIFGEGGDDTLFGDEGDDEIQGGEGADRLEGGAGNDTLFGQEGGDTLLGGVGDDYLEGGQGSDLLVGGEGYDVYAWSRGDGRDTIVDSGNNALAFGPGVTLADIRLAFGSLKLDLGSGDEIHIDGFDPADPFNTSSITEFRFDDGTVVTLAQLFALGFDLDGTPDADVVQGTPLDDRIRTFEGDDTVFAKAGNDMVDAGEGNDTVDAGDGNDTVFGGDGNDVVYGGKGDDDLEGDEGHDRLYGEKGADTLYGGEGNDLLDGGLDGDVLDGGDGDDVLLGGKGNDTLYGDDGGGADVLQGGTGNDFYFIDEADTIVEDVDQGTDTVTVTFDYALGDNVENLVLAEGSAAVVGEGNELANTITGNEQDNSLFGGDGDDVLFGRDGNDSLDGGAGADVLAGGLGDDTYYVDSEDDFVEEEVDVHQVVINLSTGEEIHTDIYGGVDTVVASSDYTRSATTSRT